MSECEMPFAAASFLNSASQGSKLPLLRQLACAHAADGSTRAISRKSQYDRVICIMSRALINRIFASNSRFDHTRLRPFRPLNALAMTCPHEAYSPILRITCPERLRTAPVLQDSAVLRRKDDQFSTTS